MAGEADVLSVLPLPVYLPRVIDKTRMEFLETGSSDKLERGMYDIFQPSAENPGLNRPLSIEDLVIVPCLAVNKERFRLGRGGGYYDRMRDSLQKARTVALIPSELAELDFPGEAHDLQIDVLITEKGILS